MAFPGTGSAQREGAAGRPQAASVPAGEEPGESLSLATLRTLHLDLLRRPPFDAERTRFSADLSPAGSGDAPGTAAGPVQLSGKVEALLASREHWQQWYEEQLYYF